MILNLFILTIFNLFSFYVLYKFSYVYKLLDFPDKRKLHTDPIPLIGGLVVYLTLILSLYLFEYPEEINLIIVFSGIIVLTGLLDDFNQLNIPTRIIFILAACYLLVTNGLVIEDIGDYNGKIINLGSFAIIFTILCVAGLTNAYNFLDGQDGLLLTQIIISYLILYIYSYLSTNNFYFLNFLFVISTIIILGLIYNFGIIYKYKVFLGDSGSMFFGFSFGFILIFFAKNDTYLFHKILAIWSVSLPVFDFISTVIRRIIKKKSPFSPDRTHVHHLLLVSIKNQHLVLFLYSVLSIFFGIIGYVITLYLGSIISLITYIFLIIVFTATSHIIEQNNKSL